MVSLIYIVFLFVQILMSGIDFSGYFSTIVSIMIIGGTKLIFIGVLGEYIGKIYNDNNMVFKIMNTYEYK